MILQGLKPRNFKRLNKFKARWVAEPSSVLWSLRTTLFTNKRRIPLRSTSVRTPHLFHHGIPKVFVTPQSKGITSV
jgi:hypothetical protein